MKNGIVIGLVVVVLAVVGVYIAINPNMADRVSENPVEERVSYTSSDYGLTFLYPKSYFIVERDLGNGERYHHQIALYKDTQENRDVIAGKSPGREGPVSITFDIYQNNLDNLTPEVWVKNTSSSNFKLSDGVLTPATVSGTEALSYRYSGLYENDALVFAHKGNMVLAGVSFITPEEEIRVVFSDVIESVVLSK